METPREIGIDRKKIDVDRNMETDREVDINRELTLSFVAQHEHF
jgi:hypothetical protein